MWRGGSTADVSASDRFDWFIDAVTQSLAPMALTTDDASAFHAEGAALELGSVQVSRFSYSPLRSWRSAAQIRRGDPEQYQLGLVTKGSMWLSQRGTESGMFSGDMVLWDTSYPYEAGCGLTDPTVEAFVLQIPKCAMPLRPNHVDRLLARNIPASTGMGAILAQFLTTLASHGSDLRPHQLSGLGTTAADLAAACLAEHLGDVRQAPAEASPTALLHRIDAFIRVNLADPDLTPRLIADHHHISLRTLYALFQDRQEGVAESIRRHRLEQCCDDLARPRLADQPVQAIATRWGFASATAFSRAFRAAYGATPTEYRRLALSAAGLPAVDAKTVTS